MKVSTIDNDKLLMINCEKFEGGKTNIKSPNTIRIIGFLSLFVIPFIYGISLRGIKFYINNHLMLSLSITFLLITVIISITHDFFLKTPVIRTYWIYQVDNNGCFSSYDGKIKTISGIDIEGKDNIVKSFKIVVDMPIGSYEEDALYISSDIFYKVIVELNSGKYFSIEENSIGIYSHPENQVAFSKLMTETNIAADQIKSFLDNKKLGLVMPTDDL
jgi:hypothetical protein